MTETALSDIQKWMQATLINPNSPANAEAPTRLLDTPTLSARDALAIYQRSYYLRLTACMRDQFPALCHALGEDLFNAFVADYVAAAPPESYTLYDLGRRFADFLAAGRPDQGDAGPEPWVDFMIDLARFERQVFVTFDCPGAEGQPLADHTTPDADLRVQPSLSLGSYGFEVPAYYHAVRDGAAPDIPAQSPTFVAVVRKDYLTTTLPLTQPHFVFLSAMVDGASVETALARVATTMNRDLSDVTTGWHSAPKVRAAWIDAGFFFDQGKTPA